MANKVTCNVCVEEEQDLKLPLSTATDRLLSRKLTQVKNMTHGWTAMRAVPGMVQVSHVFNQSSHSLGVQCITYHDGAPTSA